MACQVVPINQVVPLSSSIDSIRRMRTVLQRQGQIEPLQVKSVGDKFIPFSQDVWADEIIFAARALGWDTLLITVMKRYEA